MNSINNNNALNLSNSMSTAISSDLVGESFSQTLDAISNKSSKDDNNDDVDVEIIIKDGVGEN
ncbi:14378_t:CDS:2, partial [Entrophospora sp. SA101]